MIFNFSFHISKIDETNFSHYADYLTKNVTTFKTSKKKVLLQDTGQKFTCPNKYLAKMQVLVQVLSDPTFYVIL